MHVLLCAGPPYPARFVRVFNHRVRNQDHRGERVLALPILHFVNAFTNVSVNAYIPDENDPLFPPVEGIVNAYLLIISDDFYTRRPSARWPGTPFLPVIRSISRGIPPDLRPGAATARSIFSISSIQKGREGNCRVERLRMFVSSIEPFLRDRISCVRDAQPDVHLRSAFPQAVPPWPPRPWTLPLLLSNLFSSPFS